MLRQNNGLRSLTVAVTGRKDPAVSALGAEHRAQVINHLKASDFRVGLLVNFGGSHKAQIERFVR